MAAARNIASTVAKRTRKPGKPTLTGETKKNVQYAVRVALARLDNNQTALGQAIGATQSSVSQWASGQSSPGMPNIEALARLLDKRVAEVLEGDRYPLETCLAYWAGRWGPSVVAEARRLAEKGEKHDARGWTDRLDQLAKDVTRR